MAELARGPTAAARSLNDLLRARARATPSRRAYTFLRDGETESAHLGYGELDLKARAIGALLQESAEPGQRALLVLPPGLDFVAAFLGCLYSGLIAVPVYPPRLNRHGAARDLPRLRAVTGAARPAIVVSTAGLASEAAGSKDLAAVLGPLEWLPADAADPAKAAAWRDPGAAPETLAFLQFTSGSTGDPKGVMVSHGNLLHNTASMERILGYSERSVFVSWLPLYHDMGLIGVVLQSLSLGAHCVLMSPMSFLQKPRRWLRAISRYRGTASGAPNFAYDLCVRTIAPREREGLDLGSWEVAFNAAEPIRAETLERFAGAFEPYGFRRRAMTPSYGLAEATLIVAGDSPRRRPRTRQPAEAAGGGSRPLVSCGRPLADQQVVIVDPELREPCAEGRVGEIWVRGPSVARGYWERPEQTRETFRARLAGGRGGGFLRTGDLGVLERGELFITGRIKDLVILRGRNLYPQDIELAAEASHGALRPGCGAAFSVDVDDEERLVVLFEVKRHPKAGVEEVASAVRQAVARQLEAHVYEVVLLRTGTIAKTTSGKIRRLACRADYLEGRLAAVGRSRSPEPALAQWLPGGGDLDREAFFSLDTAERRALAEAFVRREAARVLRLESAAIELGRPLTDLGLDSLSAVGLGHEIERALGIEVPLAWLFEGRTGTELVDLLAAAELAPPAGEIPVAAEAAAEHPLSYGQEALFFIERLAPGTGAYNIAVAARVLGEPDRAAFSRAVRALAERHPALRTSFTTTAEGEPVARVRGSFDVDFACADLAVESEAGVRRLLGREAFRPFDLANGAPLRARLWRRAPEKSVLLLVVHHLVADFWSMSVLMRDLAALYARHRGDGAGPPAASAVRYSDYVRWQEQRMEGAPGRRLWRYWRERLGGELPVLELPLDRPYPPVQTYRGAACPRILDAELTEALLAAGRVRGATLFTTLLAAFQVLLHRYSGATDVLVGSPTAGRVRPELAGLVGYLVNPVLLRACLAGDPSFEVFLEAARRDVLGALEHQEYPFALLARRLQPERDPSHPPLCQVLFVMETAPAGSDPGLAAFAAAEAGGRARLADLELESIRLDERRSQFHLSLVAALSDSSLTATLQYNPDLFDACTVRRLVRHLEALLRAVVAEPARRVSALSLLRPSERAQLAVEWNAAGERPRRELLLHELFEARCDEEPEALALVAAARCLSYRELDRRANELAHRLRRRGVGPEVRVGVLLERSAEMVIALLGVLKSGGAYVPLDPEYPRERLSLLLADAGAALLVSVPVLAAAAGRPAAGVVDPAARAVAGEADARPAATARADSLAYLIYTSGSTGRPKGVAIAHRAPVSLMFWARRAFTSGELAGVLASTSICFDLSVWEIFAPLSWGGTVVLAGHGLELPALEAASRVTLVNTVPSVAAELLDGGGLPRAVRAVNLAGEPLKSSLARRLLAVPGIERVLNLYGPSEDTTYSTFAAAGGAGPTLIGRPVEGKRAYLLDPGLRAVPLGGAGEICLAGDGLARGYLDRPAASAERFVANPFGPAPGARLYRTGDRARYRPGGGLDFLGRFDFQVKVRGFRVELGEVEAALERHPGVREAIVLVAAGAGRGRRLIAWAVPARVPAPGAEELRRFVARSLPRYAVPSACGLLDALPRTPNGKVDRAALARLEPARPRAAERSAGAPRTPVEEVVAAVWCEVLGVDRAGPADDFFELGGHSLVGTRVIARLRAALGVELPLARLFELRRLDGLAAALEAERRQAGKPALPPIEPLEPAAAPPLSFAQERLWFLDQLTPGTHHYNMPAEIALAGELDVAALAASLGEIRRRHATLRSAFPPVEGAAVVEVAPPARFDLPVVDLSALPAAGAERELGRRVRSEARRPFDLSRPGLFRVVLLRAAPRRGRLFLSTHHIASDGWSLKLLCRELAVLYGATAGRRESVRSPLAELPVGYGDFAAWQRRVLEPLVVGELGFWRDRLGDFPEALALPTDRPRPPVQSFRGATSRLSLGGALSARLKELGRRHGTSLFMTLLAAFQVLLSRYSGQEGVVVGTPEAARDRIETEELIGLFMNMLVLTGRPGDRGFDDLLRRTRRTVLAAHEHRHLPFERLVEELQPSRDLSRSPLFQVMFTLAESPPESIETAGLTLRPRQIDNGSAKFDWTLTAEDRPAGLTLSLEYCTDLFDASTAGRVLAHLRGLLSAAAADPAARLSALPWLAAAERHQVLREWSDSARDEPWPGGVHHLFAARAAAGGDRVAVSDGGGQWSYGELDRRGGGLAAAVRSAGARPGRIVGLAVDRSAAMVIAMLGILEAGAAYLPLDPDHPAERLAYILRDARVSLLVTERHLRTRFRGEWRVVCPEDAGRRGGDRRRPRPVAGPDELAYVIYTSGSTGRPKGVEVRHGGVVSFLRSMARQLGAGERDALLAVTTLSFDIAVLELLLPLATGGRVVIASRRQAADAERLTELLSDPAIRLMQATPATWRLLVESGWRGRDGLGILCGGEALTSELAARLLGGPARRGPAGGGATELWNLYGPTETTVWSAATRVRSARGPISIGRPIENTGLRVLAGGSVPVPIGVVGELAIDGRGLARGYLGRPALSAERFVPGPFGGRPGERLYRTGDLASFRGDGRLELHGRIDHQVKVRGFRIEPGEIEAVAGEHPGVAGVAVVASGGGSSGLGLDAFFVSASQPPPSAEDLRGFLRGKLPDYMLPSLWIPVATLPLTPNGKVDRNALGRRARSRARVPASGYVAASTPTERRLVEIFETLLPVERVGIHDSFFDRGGHSLLASRVLARIRAAFKVRVSLAELFADPTVAGLAVAIAEKRAAALDEERLSHLLAALEGMSEEETRRRLTDAA